MLILSLSVLPVITLAEVASEEIPSRWMIVAEQDGGKIYWSVISLSGRGGWNQLASPIEGGYAVSDENLLPLIESFFPAGFALSLSCSRKYQIDQAGGFSEIKLGGEGIGELFKSLKRRLQHDFTFQFELGFGQDLPLIFGNEGYIHNAPSIRVVEADSERSEELSRYLVWIVESIGKEIGVQMNKDSTETPASLWRQVLEKLGHKSVYVEELPWGAVLIESKPPHWESSFGGESENSYKLGEDLNAQLTK